MTAANFVPVRRLIFNVTNAKRAVVTTVEDHGYESDQWVRIIVPKIYGMEIFYVETKIEVTADNEFVTNVDTRGATSFSEPTAPPPFTQAQVIPISQKTDVLDP